MPFLKFLPRSVWNAATLAPIALAVLCTACQSSSSNVRKSVAVFVNGEPITDLEVRAEADRWINVNKARDAGKGLEFHESGRAQMREILRRDVLEAMIERKLIAQQLRADGIEVTDAEVETHLQQKFRAFGKTAAQAADEIVAQGKTVADVKERIRWHTLGVEKLYELHAAEKVAMSEGEARRLYEEFPSEFDREEQRRVSHILVRVPAGASPPQRNKARQQADGLLKRIQSGEDFATVAAKHSDDELSRNKGGDRGYSGRGIIRGPGDDPFGDAAFAMRRVGEISDIVATPDGYHIIQLTGLKEARRLGFDEVKEDMIADFRRREIGAFWAEFGGQLRANANLDWTSGELFRQARAKRKQEKHNEKIERMIAREQEKSREHQAKEEPRSPHLNVEANQEGT